MKLYPKINSKLPSNPNKLYAIPVFGLLIKGLMLLPVWIEIGVLFFVLYLASVANSFYVLLYGKFWSPYYEFGLGLTSLFTKSCLFLTGVTDKYPGFSFEPSSVISLEKTKSPNRLFAFPILGGVARILLLIPFYIYASIVSNSSWFGLLYAVKFVLFDGKYPELTYEIVIDSTRLNLASFLFFLGFSDSYPSFNISMNHKNAKIILLILGVLTFLLSNSSSNYTYK